jgi:hypothetical protein
MEGTVYSDGESVVKLPVMYPFREYRLFQMFDDLAPRYSPGPVSVVTVNGSNGIQMRFVGAGVHGETRLEMVMGMLQCMHCVLLVSGHLGMRELSAGNLRKRGAGSEVRFSLVHVGAWVKVENAWVGNCVEMGRLWRDVRWPAFAVRLVENSDEDIVCDIAALANTVVCEYASRDCTVPDAMNELRRAISETAMKVRCFFLVCVLYLG